MAVRFEIDCALLAGLAYQSNRDKINWFPTAPEWMEFSHVPNSSYPTSGGFEASVFQNATTGTIVISFAGTDFRDFTGDWTEANIPLAFGHSSEQLRQAALYYLQIKEANPSSEIRFTGHSLGGGLAALMSVFFNEEAITFDQAPFAAANSGEVRDDLIAYLNENGYDDAALSALVPALLNYNPDPYASDTDPSLDRLGNITSYYVQGEFLHGAGPEVFGFYPMGVQTAIPHDSVGVDASSLHSQALLSAFLLNDSFRAITAKLPELVKMVFDGKLFYEMPNKLINQMRNLLEHLLRHQIGVNSDPLSSGAATAGDSMLDRFTSDLQKVAQDGGLTLTNANLTNTLVAFAMQTYYENPEAAVAGKTLFTDVTGGIRFARADVASELQNTKGWQLYFRNYLAEEFTADELRAVEPLLPDATDWFMQAGGSSLAATAEGGNAFMVGGVGNDVMTGGAGADLLLGGEGDDTLVGGRDEDILSGGAGYDTYIVTTGDGHDTILDTDGRGTVEFDGVSLLGGAGIADGLWVSADGLHAYGFDGDLDTGGTLIIDGAIRVEDFRNGSLGITLGGPAPAPAAGTVLQGTESNDALHFASQFTFPEDFLAHQYDPVTAYGAGGHDWVGTAEGDDVLDGGDGNDWLLAYGGNDRLLGGIGDDALFPGTGENWVDAGAGDDTVIAGQYLLFDTSGDAGWDQIAWQDLGALLSVAVDSSLYWDASGETTFLVSGAAPSAAFTAPSVRSHPELNDSWQVSYELTAPAQLTYRQVETGAETVLSFGCRTIESADTVPNWISGGDGNDTLVGNDGDDMLIGGVDNDRLAGEVGADSLLGGSGDDQLLGQQGDDLLEGGLGNDLLMGGSGRDRLFGGDGDDQLRGDSGDDATGENDQLDGGAGNDQLRGDGGDDWLAGGEGSDVLQGGAGNDSLFGGSGEDTLVGGADADILDGGANADRLFGSGGDDALRGGLGSDELWGEEGNDLLDGGTDQASDTLNGGEGADTFLWRAGAGRDVLADAAAEDIVRLEGLSSDGLVTDVVQSVDGRKFLRITVDADNALLVYGGPAAGPDRYEFGDGRILTREQLLAQTMQAPLDFRLAQSGVLSGGAAADVLVGSGGSDDLRGQAGADILAGAAGDDVLAGGEGDDEYRIGPGTGEDRIVEAADETSVLRLLAGATVGDLGFQRRGDDLWIGIQDGRDGALVERFFQARSNLVHRRQ